jgi:hypothetical protein
MGEPGMGEPGMTKESDRGGKHRIQSQIQSIDEGEVGGSEVSKILV